MDAPTGDGGLYLIIRDLSDNSIVFSSEIFALGTDMPNVMGTLAAGSYQFAAGVGGSTRAGEPDGSGFSTIANLSAQLDLTPVASAGPR